MSDNEELLDDGALVLDRLVRSLHRNNDGHLHDIPKGHESAVEEHHNVAILYIYTVDKDEYMMHEHYVYSTEPHKYKVWKKIVMDEIAQLVANSDKTFYGVYGWATGHINVTILRTGDLFITVDKDGARGVRVTFDTVEDKRTTRKRAKRAKTKR